MANTKASMIVAIKDREYWKQREKDKLKANLKDVSSVDKKLRKNMDIAIKDVETEITKLYTRYAKENNLSYKEAIRLLTSKEYSSWRMDLEDYVGQIKADGNNPKLLLELNTLSAKAQITRLEESFYQIQKILDKDYKFKSKEVKDLLEKGVRNNYIQTGYTIDNGRGEHAGFSMISKSEVENILELPWSGKHYSERLWNNRTKLKNKIEEQITQATIQGKSLDKISKEVAETMDVSKNVATRLINTEHAYACAQGDLKMYQEFDIDSYEYMATLDTRTSDICKHLDGKIFKLEEAVAGVNFPPMHPHCRSTTVPADIEELEDSSRIARDEDGNNIYLKGDTKYEDYEKALTSGDWSKVASKKTE